MIYILETELAENKSVFFALKDVYGINNKRSEIICKKTGYSLNLKIKNLTPDQIAKLVGVIEASNIVLTSDLRKVKQLVMKKLIAIKSYRGLRKINGFPVRGQRTRSNARTARKNKKIN